MTITLDWTNPHGVDTLPGVGYLFYIRVVDGKTNAEYRYVGKSTRGEAGFEDYRRNLERIRVGKPRRTTPGQEKFRAVHLALAKACEFGWKYEFYPLENVPHSELNQVRASRVLDLGCNLNAGASWSVVDYDSLSISDLL